MGIKMWKSSSEFIRYAEKILPEWNGHLELAVLKQ